MPTLSVITVNRNNARNLENTIISVITQIFNDFEFIIIDGASTDKSLEIIKAYSEKITLWISEPDTGIYNAMNKGIMHASGEYLLFLNSGDILINNFILDEIFRLKFSEDIISGSVEIFSGTRKRFVICEGPGLDELTLSKLLWISLNHQATFIRRELLVKLGMYDERYRIISDWIFSLKALIFNNASYRFIKKPVAQLEPNGISGNEYELNLERIRAIKEMVPARIYKDYEKFDLYGFTSVKEHKISWYLYLLARKLALFLEKSDKHKE